MLLGTTPRNRTKWSQGQLCYAYPTESESVVTIDQIVPGLGVCFSDYTTKPNQIRNLMVSKLKLVFSGDLVASNTINGKIRGLSIAQVTYASSHANTMSLIIAAINALPGVSASLDTTDTNSRTILIVSTDDMAVTGSNWVVAAGVGQATVALTNQCKDSIAGIVVDLGNLRRIENDEMTASIVFSGDLGASNVFNMKVNGQPIAPITYATSHILTMTNIINSINSIPGIYAYLDSSDTNNRTIKIDNKSMLFLDITGYVVTGGSAVTISKTSNEGTVYYDRNTQVNLFRKASPAVPVEAAVNRRSSVYCRFVANGAGKTVIGAFRGDSDSDTCVLVNNAEFLETTTGAGLCPLKINFV